MGDLVFKTEHDISYKYSFQVLFFQVKKKLHGSYLTSSFLYVQDLETAFVKIRPKNNSKKRVQKTV